MSEAAAIQAPANPNELRQVVREMFGISVPGRRVCANHDSPMDYLTASFFAQQDLLVWANRGGGKTMLAAVATLLDAIFHAPARIRVLGGSFDQSDRLADYIRDMLERRSELLDGRATRTRVRLVGGSEIRMLAQSQRAVRGQHVQKIRCDEVDLFDADVWRAVQFATRSAGATRGSIEVLSTLHRSGGLMEKLVKEATSHKPPATREAEASPSGKRLVSGGSCGYHLIRWCLWEVIERCPPERRCDDCLLADDCRPSNSPGQDGVAREGTGFFRIDDAIAIKARSSRAAWEAEMLCKGVRRDWLVFPEFSVGRHMAPAGGELGRTVCGELGRTVEYCPDWPLYRAIDFGYRSPLVCLWIQVTPGGRVHVIDEYVRERLALTQHAGEILQRDRGRGAGVTMTYVDPAGTQKESTSGAACTEMLAAAGIPCTWRGSTIAEGLELIRAALAPAAGEPSLAIHPRCVKLIEAFNAYHYPPPGSADGAADTGNPVKDGPDHLIDALRYFFVNRARPKMGTDRKRY
jgi:hypothetical protein